MKHMADRPVEPSKDRPHGIMFHHFHNLKHPPQQGSISAQELARIIEHYRDCLLPAEEWYEKATKGILAPRDTCITFDDGLLCQYEVALSVLEHYRLTGFWFVYTSVATGSVEMLEIYRRFRNQCFTSMDHFYAQFFEMMKTSSYSNNVYTALQSFDENEYLHDFPFYSPGDRKFRFVRDVALGSNAYDEIMTLMMNAHHFDINKCKWDLWMQENHLRDLHSRGHLVGLHSHTHPTVLSGLSPHDQEKEYIGNFNSLREILGVSPVAMSHPCNSYNDSTLSILRGLGIRVGFRANMALVATASEFEFPREDHANIMRLMQ